VISAEAGDPADSTAAITADAANTFFMTGPDD